MNLITILSAGHEILTYLVSFYEKFKLYDHTKLNAEVITKTWLSDRRKWQIVIRLGFEFLSLNSDRLIEEYYYA